MGKTILGAIIVALLLFVAGCSGAKSSADTPSYEILKKSELGAKWRVHQVRLDIPSGVECPLLLRLADGDKVDGFFNLEKGGKLDLSITGNSQIHSAAVQLTDTKKSASDRFSFTASQAQGSTYTISFRNTATDKKERDIVFLEVISPIGAPIFIPLEAR